MFTLQISGKLLYLTLKCLELFCMRRRYCSNLLSYHSKPYHKDYYFNFYSKAYEFHDINELKSHRYNEITHHSLAYNIIRYA